MSGNAGNRRLSRPWLATMAGLACLAVGWFVWRTFFSKPGRPYEPPEKAFAGSSDRLRQTVIVPTLDTPIPQGKSAVWCLSFQIAWNRLKADLAREPIRLKDGDKTAAALNRAEASETDLAPGTAYAAAGLIKDGIVKKIQAEMAEKFPHASPPAFDLPATVAVAYGYLNAEVKYTYPFFDNDENFLFTDSAGRKTAVRSFGVRKQDDYAYDKLREQVRILYCPRDAVWQEKEVDEFTLDPCKDAQPYQMVLARTQRQETLAETLAGVQRKVAQTPPDEFVARLHPRDTLLVPTMYWSTEHRFKELEGEDKPFLNPTLEGLYLGGALQWIQFKMDRSGAELASESKSYVKPGASYFHLNRPFLIYLKKRDAKHPVFVMWVDNAELVCGR